MQLTQTEILLFRERKKRFHGEGGCTVLPFLKMSGSCLCLYVFNVRTQETKFKFVESILIFGHNYSILDYVEDASLPFKLKQLKKKRGH